MISKKEFYMAWILSITSGMMLWLMGNKSKWGPRLGIANQILWIVYAVSIHEWGLIPGILLYAIIHVRNLITWEKNE
jgi:hypothetical protein